MNRKMEFHEIVDVARNFAVMVRIQGPDPKGLKMLKHAFHQYNSGKTTLSASGMLLPGFTYSASIAKQNGSDEDMQLSHDSMLVLTVASVIEPFLSQQHRDDMAKDKPCLIQGVQIDIFVEGERGREHDVKEAKKEIAKWLPAELLTMVNIPVTSAAVQSILEASSGSVEHGWEVGSSLVSHAYGQQSINGVVRSQVEQTLRSQSQMGGKGLSDPGALGKSATRIALLRISSKSYKGLPKLNEAPSSKRGDVLLAMGSPFGILSPVHFFNSIAVGSVANAFPPNSSQRSLLMADIRCLPGMEGGPVFGEQAQFIGILTRPLRQRTSGAEVQLVIPWEAIACACNDSLKEAPQVRSKELYGDNGKLKSAKNSSPIRLHPDGSSGHFHELLHTDSSLASPIVEAMSSICLISTDDGAWASGVLLNSNGLVITNAHLLEPWRFRKAAAIGENNRTKSVVRFMTSEECLPLTDDSFGGRTSQDLQPRGKTANISIGDECAESRFDYIRNVRHKRIQVRLDFKEPWTWSDAKIIYVSKGPLDIALLQLESVPDQLLPININFRSPSPGSKVYVVGHGLFGHQCELLPSACLGVIAKVVEAKKPLIRQSFPKPSTVAYFPVMLQTTAAVHPGGSGGAVIDIDGRMIGLVTSNARHGGGMVIPHLNFSIPCAALEPIFSYSQDMQDLSLLDDLDKPNEDISSVWALTPAVSPISPKPGPLLPSLPNLPEDNEKSLKGSRFSKFIAERHELMKEPTRRGEVVSVSNKHLPSKL